VAEVARSGVYADGRAGITRILIAINKWIGLGLAATMGIKERILQPPAGMRSRMPSIEAILRMAPGFDQWSNPVLEHLAAVVDVVEVSQGEVLFREGSMPESLYILLEGRVSLTGMAVDSSSAVIDILGPGTSFVLANVLTDEPYLTGAEVVTASVLIRIPAVAMRAAVAAPPAAMAMMRVMSAELDALTRQVADLKVRIVAQRLGTYLLDLVGDPTASQADFRLPISKGLLASLLGCRAENISRAFLGLRAYGVETSGSRVMLHDIPQLRAYAGATLLDSDAAGRLPVERVLSDAFRLHSNRPRES
jgi:CRP/FNR family transcriptional regulator, transcriptional activator FtrB